MSTVEERLYDTYWSEGCAGWAVEGELTEPMRELIESVARGKDVLDFGGGDGERYGAVVRAVAATYTVADVSHEILIRRRALGDRTLHVDDLRDTSEAFDVVLALEVLEHLLDPVEALRAAADRLRPGGVAVVSVPNAFSGWNRLRMLGGRLPASGVGAKGAMNARHYLAPHIRFFDLASLTSLVQAAGLRVERVCSDGIDVWWRIRARIPMRMREIDARKASPLTPADLIVVARK